MSIPSSMTMDLQFSTTSLLPFLTFLIFLFIILIKTAKGSISKLPPGPRKLPIIGNLHQLRGALPHRSLRDLAKLYGPIMYLKLGQVSTIVISSAEAAKEVLKTHDLILANRPQLLAPKIIAYNATNMAFSPYGDYWRQLRKICVLELLTVKRVQSYRSIREEETQSFIKSISSSLDHCVNLSEELFKLTNNVVCRAMFGKKCKHQDEFIREVTKAIKLASGFSLPDLFPSLKLIHSISTLKPALEEIHCRMDRILGDIIDEHKVEMVSDKLGKEDLIDVLLKVQQSGDLDVPITTDNIKALILDLFTAGSETSSTTIVWAMCEMMRNPRVMEKAQAEVRQVFRGKTKVEEVGIQELSYLKLVIKETLRLHPPLPLLLPREASERCEMNGYEVPNKSRVIINVWAIGRDPQHWTNAECFEPERFSGSSIDFKGGDFEFIPFGGGRRVCPGISFGIINVELQLASLLYHFDWEAEDGIHPEELDMTEALGAIVRRKKDLILNATLAYVY